MSFRLKGIFSGLMNAERSEKIKLLFLSLTFFSIISAYTVIRDLKNSIFIGLVGKEYIPLARIIVLVMLIPAILIYSKLVDKVRRYYLLGFYSLFYSVLCLIFAFFVGHSTIGIGNTDQSPYRLFGWLFYFFIEGFTPFVLSVFWAFSNSVNNPDSAKKNYGFMVASSKLGGMFSAGIAWALFSATSVPLIGCISDVAKHRAMLVFASVFLFFVPILISFLMKIVPGRYLHGYEAVYKIEKDRSKAGKEKTGMLSGLFLLLRYPYVMGIFFVVFFYEILNTVLSYLRLGVAASVSKSIAGTSGFLFKWVFFMHSIGLVISLFGTSALLRKLGTRVCILLIPIMMGVVVLCFVAGTSPFVLMVAFIFMKSINYAFSKPVTESLYIPTMKAIKFKSKSWIDAFGSKLAKGSGSVYNLFVGCMGAGLFLPLYSFFFAIVIGLWFIAAYLLGGRFEKAVSKNEAIGACED